MKTKLISKNLKYSILKEPKTLKNNFFKRQFEFCPDIIFVIAWKIT